MAPAATTQHTVPVPEPAAKAAPPKIKTLGGSGSAVPAPDQVLPELRTDHREPLKLSGALDKYEHFDVTPIIGREFVDVDLAEFLSAPNSDELLRDLAITGLFHLTSCRARPVSHPFSNTERQLVRLIELQFLSVALFSSGSRIISPMTSKKSLFSVLASSPASRPLLSFTSTQS